MHFRHALVKISA